MADTFKGKRILVTGAGQGIGRESAMRLSSKGGTVLALDVNNSLLTSLKADHPSIETSQIDLSDWNKTQKVIRALYPIDLLVNNAGVCYIEPLSEVSEEHYDSIFNINVKALINVTKTVVENLLERQAPGSIVNISSQASKAGLLNHTLYCASKGSVDAFTRAAALEFGPKGIRVNSVNPTVVMTELGRKIWCESGMGGKMLEKIPLGKFAQVDDVVDAVLFLLGDNAKMISGVALPVDGGFLAC